jgi:hypothetical protein
MISSRLSNGPDYRKSIGEQAVAFGWFVVRWKEPVGTRPAWTRLKACSYTGGE